MNDLDANLSDCASNKLYAVSPNDVEVIAASLISDSKKKYNLRSRVMPHETDAFISNRRSDEILVVYPFGVDKNKTEAAADGLKELSWSEKFKGENQDSVEPKNDNKMDSATSTSSNESSENLLTTVQSGQRSHFIEIRVEDYEKLATGQWLNDSLVDMWMQWTSRHIACKRSSNFHFFTSHFYTTLASAGGVTGVRSWTAKKNINIFEKRLIFIPINKTLHWSLCVVVNPGAIISSVDDDDNNDWKDRLLPCMLFFDSLNMHRKARVHSDVTKWLNSEWKRMKGSDHGPFNKHSCKIYDPQGTPAIEL
jgi:Ulp1 family protease